MLTGAAANDEDEPVKPRRRLAKPGQPLKTHDEAAPQPATASPAADGAAAMAEEPTAAAPSRSLLDDTVEAANELDGADADAMMATETPLVGEDIEPVAPGVCRARSGADRCLLR